jgi:hypothetical protein
MPRRSSHRLGGGQHDRRVERIDELEPELLSQLARRRGSRMLIRLDVASGRQPKASVLVINQQHMLVIDNYEVRHKVFRRHGRLLQATQLRARVDPRKGIFNVRALEAIDRLDRRNLISNRAAHVGGLNGSAVRCRKEAAASRRMFRFILA